MSDAISISLSNLPQIEQYMTRFNQLSEKAIGKAMFAVGSELHKESVKNAPISPTAAMLAVKNAITGRARPNARRATRTSGPKPGTLIQSISFTSDATKAVVYVPSNSGAGRYAAKIHDEKGKSWFNRGIGTKIKGARADEKFIQRAFDAFLSSGKLLKLMSGAYKRETGVELK